MGGNKCGAHVPGKIRSNRTTLVGWTQGEEEEEKIPETITAGSLPQATSSRDNWSLLASVVHRRGLWKNSPPPDWVTTPDKGPAQLRHNRAAQAEVTTPYPAPRLPGPPATVAHCGGWKPPPRNRERDGAQQEQQPLEQRGKRRRRLVKNATRDNRGDGFKMSREIPLLRQRRGGTWRAARNKLSRA